MKSTQSQKLLIAAAVTGMIIGLTTTQASFAKGKSDGKIQCKGTNECKGKGACKGADHACGGKNACKGQGITMKDSKKDCTDAGGTVAE